MFKKDTIQRLKQSFAVIIIGAILSIIPFYFETRAMTHENALMNERNEQRIDEHEIHIQQGMVNDAIEKTETEQIKETLKRIETKLDRLIEKQVKNPD